VERYELLEQRDGRVSVDGVAAANHGLQPFQVNGPQHRSLDAVGLAFVSGAAVCLTQLGELVGV